MYAEIVLVLGYSLYMHPKNLKILMIFSWRILLVSLYFSSLMSYFFRILMNSGFKSISWREIHTSIIIK